MKPFPFGYIQRVNRSRRRATWGSFLAAGGLCLARPAAGEGYATALVVREFLGRSWTNELLQYAFAPGQADCHPDSIRLASPAGNAAVQLTQVAYRDGTDYVRTGVLSFVASLGPMETATNLLTYGPEPAIDPMPATDLSILFSNATVDIRTQTFGMRLLHGERSYSPAAVPAEVPGPVVDMRLPCGGRFGGSAMYGTRRITGYAAELVARGPVVAEWRCRYDYEGGETLDMKVQLGAADSLALWDVAYSGDDANDGVRLDLSTHLDGLRLHWQAEYYDERNKWAETYYTNGAWVFPVVDVDLMAEPEGEIVRLTPWNDWWDGRTQTEWLFKSASTQDLLRVRSVDPGVWVVPDPPGTWASHGRVWPRMVPLWKEADNRIAMRVTHTRGRRKWLMGTAEPALGRELNVIHHYVLEWPDAVTNHPHLFMNAAQLADAREREIDPDILDYLMVRARGQIPAEPHSSDACASAAWLLTADPGVAAEGKLVERLRHHLNLFGNFDVMRGVFNLCGLYDTVMSSDLIAEGDRALFRAQLAYLGYRIADPATWSMERGYCSGNLNMSVSHVLNKGIVACALPNHPMAGEWLASGLAMLEQMLEENVSPAGEWPESVANYAHVSASSLITLAIACREAGFADFVSDPRMLRLMLYLAKQYTPPDPRHLEQGKNGTSSLLPPVGRGGAGGRWVLPGVMARAAAPFDTGYAAVQQWVWLREGAPYTIDGNRFGGWEYVYADPRFAAQTPDWQLDVFPLTGAILRHGLGTPAEWYVYLMAESRFAYPSESGGFPAVFARGVPVSARFAGGYAEREELLISRVLPARERGTFEERRARFYHDGDRRITAHSALPRQQYVRGDFTIGQPRFVSTESGAYWNHMKPLPEWPPVAAAGEPPIEWRRQVLFVRDDDPDGAGYLVLRDTVSGGQPTQWQFWTVSEKIGTPEQVADREAFLADAPGAQMADARELPLTNRYTALGPYGMDVEFFVAAPVDTPRYTLRWGTSYPYSPSLGYEEYQDMLYLSAPGTPVADGYHVAVFPRKPHEAVPSFETLANGSVVRVSGAFGTDYTFLSSEPQTVSAQGIAFTGTAGSVQDRAHGQVLALGAEGSASYGGYAFTSSVPASLRVTGGSLYLHFSPDREGVARVEAEGVLHSNTPFACAVYEAPHARDSVILAGLEEPAGTNRSPVLVISVYTNAPRVEAGRNTVVNRTVSPALRLRPRLDAGSVPQEALTVRWSLVEGPGGALFSDTSAVDSTVSFSAPGTYVLRLTVQCGAHVTYDDVTVRVTDTNPLSRLPFRESFEGYAEETPVSGINGWRAAAPSDARAEYGGETWHYAGLPPIAGPHEMVLRVDGGAENLFEDAAGTPSVWIDLLLQCERWEGDAPPAVTDEMQLAVYVTAGGRCAISLPRGSWTELPATSIAQGDWFRLTVEADYGAVGGAFRLWIDGTPVTDPQTWFPAGLAGEPRFGGFGFQGRGRCDDIVVDDYDVLQYRKVSASCSGLGTVLPPGDSLVPIGGDIVFQFLPSNYCHVAEVRVDGEVLARTPDTYGFSGVFANHSVHASFLPNLVLGVVPELWLAEAHPAWTNRFEEHALSDGDGDGMAAWQEYVAGTHPTNAASRFDLQLVRTNGRTAVRFYGIETRGFLYRGMTRLYSMERSDGLTNGWFEVPGYIDIPGRNRWVYYTNAPGAPGRFFRASTRLESP